MAWSFELQWSSLGVLCEICGSISRHGGGHGCGFYHPGLVNCVCSPFLPILWIAWLSLPNFITFLCQDLIYLWSASDGQCSKFKKSPIEPCSSLCALVKASRDRPGMGEATSLEPQLAEQRIVLLFHNPSLYKVRGYFLKSFKLKNVFSALTNNNVFRSVVYAKDPALQT